MYQEIQTRFVVARLSTAGTRRDQPRDGGVGSQALQVQRWKRGRVTGRTFSLNGSGCSPSGEAVSVVSEARQSSDGWTPPIQRSPFPEVSQTGTGCHVTKEVPNVMAGAARPTDYELMEDSG